MSNTLANDLHRKLLVVFSKLKPVPLDLLHEVKDVETLTLMQDYLIATERTGLDRRHWLSPSERVYYTDLALALYEHGGEPLRHLDYQIVDSLNEEVNRLPEELGRSLFEGSYNEWWTHSPIPNFVTENEFMTAIEEAKVRWMVRGARSRPDLTMLIQESVKRFDFTKELLEFLNKDGNDRFVPFAYMAPFIEVMDNDELIVDALAHMKLKAIIANPHVNQAHVHRAFLQVGPLQAANMVKKLSKNERTAGFVSEYVNLAGEFEAGEAPIELIDKLKRVKASWRNRSKDTHAKESIVAAEDAINNFEENYKNLVTRANRARSNAEKGKVTLEYATKLDAQVKHALKYKRGRAMIAHAQSIAGSKSHV